MELIQQRTHNYINSNGHVELAVFDLVGQLLAVLLEKYNVEIIIESKYYWCTLAPDHNPEGFIKTIITCEEVMETEERIDITLCGEAKCRNLHSKTFTLFLSLCLKNNFTDLRFEPAEGNNSVKSLLLQFGRKAEQLSDSIFKVELVRREPDGCQQILGDGRGILVFGREKTFRSN